MMITIRNASESPFGRAQGKTVLFENEETRKLLFGGKKNFWGTILIQIETVKPEGGKDCWNFTGQVLSKRSLRIKQGTSVTGFYRGSDGGSETCWGAERKMGGSKQGRR